MTISQTDYAKKLNADRRAMNHATDTTVEKYRALAVEMSRRVISDIRYSYDQARAARNIAATINLLQGKIGRDIEDVWQEVQGVIRQGLIESGKMSAEQVDQMLGIDRRTLMMSPAQAIAAQKTAALIGFSADLIKNIKADVLRTVNANIQLGVIAGKSPSAIISELAGVLPTKGTRFDSMTSGPLIRAEAITRTEIGRIYSQGQQARAEGYDEEGLDVKKIWLHSGNPRNPRHGHERMNGQIVGIKEKFRNPSTGARLLYPRDPAADASETVNCGCRMSIIPADKQEEFKKVA